MKKCSGTIVLAFVAGIILLLGGGIDLWAQGGISESSAEEEVAEDLSEGLAEAEELSEDFTLEEVIVTAQKRAENQQKVPIAMDVISAEEITREGKNNVDEILSDLSNVFINTNTDGMRVSIRGLGDETEGIGGGMMSSTPMVAVNIDGTYNSLNNAGNNLFDVERVEILYGPQSTLYSSNSPGGIVNIVTASPKTDRYSANASYQYGSYDEENIQLALNAPIWSDKIAMRLSGSKSQRGTWVEGSTPSKTDAVRLKTLWNATDKLSISLTGNWSKAGSGGLTGGSVLPFVHQDDDVYPDGTPLTDPWTLAGDEFGQDASTNDQITKGVSADISWDTFLGALSITPNYSESTTEGWGTIGVGGGPGFDPPPDGGAPPGGAPPMMAVSTDDLSIAQQAADDGNDDANTQQMYQDRTTTQEGLEVRMTSPRSFSLFTWIAGGTYNKSEDKSETTYEDGTDTKVQGTGRKSYGTFANVSYPLWFYKSFSLTVGYRQSWDESSHENSSAPSGANNVSMNYSEPDFKYGFEWTLATNLMLYGSYSSSYRTDAMGSLSYDVATGETITLTREPEENHNYSVGLKSRWLNNRLQVNVSTYYYDYRNSYVNEGNNTMLGYFEMDDITNNGEKAYLSTDLELITDPESDYYGLYKVDEPNMHGFGDKRNIGIDTSISWVPSSRDRVNFSVSYLSSEWTDLVFDHYYDTVFPDYNYKGVTCPNSPEWSLTASYQHNFNLWRYGTFTPRVDWQYRSAFNLVYQTTSLENSGEPDPGYYYQEPYNLYNASISFQPSGSHWYLNRWSLNVSVDNITNYAVKRSYSTRETTLMIGDPRTYSATFSLRF